MTERKGPPPPPPPPPPPAPGGEAPKPERPVPEQPVPEQPVPEVPLAEALRPERRQPEKPRSEFHLVPLDCPSCGAAVAAEGEDVVYYCTACRNGYRFDQEARRLVPLEVAFVSLPQVAADRYLPFWLLPAQVTMHERSASGFSGLLRFFFGGGDEAGGTGRGTFAVPAFHAPLTAVTELTRRYTEKLPQLGERLGERLVGGRYGAEDARKLAHFAVIATEVEKPDTLKNLRYEIEFGEARLLGVPFVRRGDGLADALFGIPV